MRSLPTFITGQQALEAPVNNVVVYPYGSNIRQGSGNELETYLSIMSTMSIDAGIELGLQRPDRKLTLPGETPYDDLDSTTDLWADRATHAGVAEGALNKLYQLLDGRKLNNTYLQSQGVSEHFDDEAIDPNEAIGVALDYHAARVYGALDAFKLTHIHFFD